MSAPIFERLRNHCHKRTYPAQSTIVHRDTPSDRLFLLLEGSVSVLQDDENGRELVMTYLNPGDIFGELGLFIDSATRSAWIRARSQCIVGEISYRRFQRLFQADPALLPPVVKQLALRLYQTNQRARELAFEDVRGRVLAVLLELANQPDAIAHPEGKQIKTTRIELGRLVGCSREMAGRVLRDLQTEQLIDMHGKTILVHAAR